MWDEGWHHNSNIGALSYKYNLDNCEVDQDVPHFLLTLLPVNKYCISLLNVHFKQIFH